MSFAQIGNQQGVTARSGGATAGALQNLNGGTDLIGAGSFDADMSDVSAMRSRLATINGSLYTATYLNQLTYNDMVYALRLADAASTI